MNNTNTTTENAVAGENCDKLKATFTGRATSFNTRHRKDGYSGTANGFSAEYVTLGIIRENYIEPIVTARLYCTGQTWTACLWVRMKGTSTQGSGMARGYGYHKPSAAIGEAIRNAGFDLSADIHGRGDAAIREALDAIAASVGAEKVYFHHAHA